MHVVGQFRVTIETRTVISESTQYLVSQRRASGVLFSVSDRRGARAGYHRWVVRIRSQASPSAAKRAELEEHA